MSQGKFRKFLETVDSTWVGYNGAYSGRDSGEYQFPEPVAIIPDKTASAEIAGIDYTSNPIKIHLKNGPTLAMTKKQWDNATQKWGASLAPRKQVKVVYDPTGKIKNLSNY